MNKEEKQKLLTTEFNNIYELLVNMSDNASKHCSCDGEYIDGYAYSTECNNHKAERFLTELGL